MVRISFFLNHKMLSHCMLANCDKISTLPALNDAIKSLGIENPDAEFERPRDSLHGDRAASSALKLARVLKSKPLDIANKIAENLKSSTRC